MATLPQYRVQVRRLINDLQSSFYPDPELNDYINEARRQVAIPTAAVRSFQGPFNLTVGKDKYLFSEIPLTANTIDVINIWLAFGSMRYRLKNPPFTLLSTFFNPWKNYQTFPVAFTRYGPNIIWMAPPPNTTYSAEYDTAIITNDLISDTDTSDALPAPYNDAVKYYAAKLARFRMQQYQEAEAMDKVFDVEIMKLNAMFPRTIPDIYGEEDLTLG